jgi:hypothetical protein
MVLKINVFRSGLRLLVDPLFTKIKKRRERTEKVGFEA